MLHLEMLNMFVNKIILWRIYLLSFINTFDKSKVSFIDGSTSENRNAHLGCSTVGRGVAHPDEGPALLEVFGRVRVLDKYTTDWNIAQISQTGCGRLSKYCTDI